MPHFPGEVIAQLEPLYNDLGPAIAQGDKLRQLAFRIAGEQPEDLIVSVATLKDVWVPENFLQRYKSGKIWQKVDFLKETK